MGQPVRITVYRIPHAHTKDRKLASLTASESAVSLSRSSEIGLATSEKSILATKAATSQAPPDKVHSVAYGNCVPPFLKNLFLKVHSEEVFIVNLNGMQGRVLNLFSFFFAPKRKRKMSP